MRNLSKAAFHDAGANKPPTRAFQVNGERRLDKYPSGHVERWVDQSGNVMFIQIIPPGIAKSRDYYDRARAKLENQIEGDRRWIEHKTCPLAHGKLEPEYFEAQPALMRPCKKGTYGKGQACPHVEFVIKTRRAEHKAAVDLRRAPALEERKRREQQEQDQVNQTRRLNDNIQLLVEGLVGTKGRGKTKPASKPPAASKASRKTAPVVAAAPAPDPDAFDEPDDLELAGITPEKPPRARVAKKKKTARKQ